MLPAPLLPLLLRAAGGRGAHADAARRAVVWLLLARLMADAGHAGPPHRPARPPRRTARHASLRHRRDALAGRRPRG